jgi:hypothetical protein
MTILLVVSCSQLIAGGALDQSDDIEGVRKGHSVLGTYANW